MRRAWSGRSVFLAELTATAECVLSNYHCLISKLAHMAALALSVVGAFLNKGEDLPQLTSPFWLNGAAAISS